MITQILSFDGNTFLPDYEVGFVTASEPRLPAASVETLQRIGAWPVIVALQRKPHRLALLIRIVPQSGGSNLHALRSQLFRWFDPEDETPKTLVGLNHDGVAMSVEALCEELRVYGDQQHDSCFVATLAVDGDVRWRAVVETDDTWNITASGQTRAIDNSGEDEAYPVFEITPTGVKAGGYAYKRYALVTWLAINAGPNYPIRLGPLNTQALVGAGKMQADGDDLRVFVDGLEVPRHLVDINTANTYIWFSANWQVARGAELAADIAGAGTIAIIEVDDVSGFPESGRLRIDNETFNYTSRDVVNNHFVGITREVWNTAAGAHVAGADVYWMQHEVVLAYGDAGAAAPAASPETEPVFELDTSDNDTWLFEVFGETAYPGRPASWGRWGNLTLTGGGGTYSATQRTLASPYTVAGAWAAVYWLDNYGWNLYNPCGIVNAAWADGLKRAVVKENFNVNLLYFIRGDMFWTTQAALANPVADNVWEAWAEPAAGADWDPADSLAILSTSTYQDPFLPGVPIINALQDVEAGTVTVSLNTPETPVTSIGNEIGNYTLALTLTNQTTGEVLAAAFEMALNETLEIDTDERTVTYLLDESSQFQAVDLDSVRRCWLRLLPGSNTLRFDDLGTAAVTLALSFRRRYY